MTGSFLTGGYASPAEEAVCRWDYDTDAAVLSRRWSLRGLNSPTYLLRHPNGRILYSGEKGAGADAGGFLVTYALADGPARVLSKLPAVGVSPCHLALDETNAFLFVSCYASGTLAVFRLDGDGLPVERCDVVRHKGRGADPERQEGPHIHFAACRGDVVYVCDLGLDTVFRYRLDRLRGTLSPAGPHFSTLPGEGPRHLAFHPTLPGWVCLLTEMAGRVYVLREGAEGLETVQVISALPEGFGGENTAAAIRFTADGAFLLTSNRGHDSIAVFPVRADGTLGAPVFSACGGSGPRDFHLAGDLVLSANQYDGKLAVLALERESCRLVPLAAADGAGQPTCVLPL